MTTVERDQLNLVRVAFAGAALSFGLPKRATLQDLAEEVSWLGQHYGTKPLFVEVRVRGRPMRKAFDAREKLAGAARGQRATTRPPWPG